MPFQRTKNLLHNNHVHSRLTDIGSLTMALPKLTKLELQIMEALMDQRAVLRPRDSGIVSRQEKARLYYDPDDGLPSGSQEGIEADQEDRHGLHFRGGGIA